MHDLLWQARFRRKLRPRQATGDTTYGTVENVVAIEDEGIRAYVPLPDFDRRTPGFGKLQVADEAEANVYRCPGGEVLRPIKRRQTQPVRICQAPVAACNACPLKKDYTTSPRGRRVARHAYEAYKKAMRKRQVWVEPLFAEAKESHGLRRLRLRGLANANIQGLLVAAGQNLNRLLAATGWGRRHAPRESLVTLPEPSRQLPAAST